jgi:hypothetical protein
MLDFWWAAPPHCAQSRSYETTTARETLGGHTLERPMRRLRADRGDNPDPGIHRQSTCRSMLTGAMRLDNEPQCAPGATSTVCRRSDGGEPEPCLKRLPRIVIGGEQ